MLGMQCNVMQCESMQCNLSQCNAMRNLAVLLDCIKFKDEEGTLFLKPYWAVNEGKLMSSILEGKDGR